MLCPTLFGGLTGPPSYPGGTTSEQPQEARHTTLPTVSLHNEERRVAFQEPITSATTGIPIPRSGRETHTLSLSTVNSTISVVGGLEPSRPSAKSAVNSIQRMTISKDLTMVRLDPRERIGFRASLPFPPPYYKL